MVRDTPVKSAQSALDVKIEQSNPLMVRGMKVRQSVERQCLIPPKGFKSWNQGQLTLVYPTVKRNCSKLIVGESVTVEVDPSPLWHAFQRAKKQ